MYDLGYHSHQATLSNKYNYNLVTIVAYIIATYVASYSAKKFAAGCKVYTLYMTDWPHGRYKHR